MASQDQPQIVTPAYEGEEAITTAVEGMNATLDVIRKSLETLGRQTAEVSSNTQSTSDGYTQIRDLRRRVRHRSREEETKLADLRDLIGNGIKEQITNLMREHIREQLKVEIASQTSLQVHQQIHEFLPVPLEKQAAETRVELEHIQRSLNNSESRRLNAFLTPDCLDDALSVVLRPNGEASQMWPADLRSLYSYDDDSVRALTGDHGLPECAARQENLQNFLEHIGLQITE